MEKEIVTKNHIVYGRVQVTLPMPVKNSMLEWYRKSGMGKAEFFRVALMMGVMQLAQNMNAKNPEENYSQEEE